MQSELSFLMDLFLDEELPKNIKIKIKERIKEVENHLMMPIQVGLGARLPIPQSAQVTDQAPSMQRLMQANPDLIPKTPEPVTAAAAQALAQRQSMINDALKAGPESGRKSARKF